LIPFRFGEGEIVPGTALFPNDPARRIEIVWKDRAAQRRPRYVQLGRRAVAWRPPEGIAIGTSLAELERINGRPFHIAGFAFDGAGAVTSWDSGRLEPRAAADCRLRVRLDSLTVRATQSAHYRALRGDRDFSSTNSGMRSLNPRVSSLLLEYP
jgi:hypothetical protein